MHRRNSFLSCLVLLFVRRHPEKLRYYRPHDSPQNTSRHSLKNVVSGATRAQFEQFYIDQSP